MWKWLLNLLKPAVAKLVDELKTSRDANIASIEATVGAGATTAEAAVTGFVASEAKKNAELAIIVPLVEPALVTELTALVGQGENSVPALYDAVVAWLEREETVL